MLQASAFFMKNIWKALVLTDSAYTKYIHKRDVDRKIKVKEHRFALSLYKISTLRNKELGKRLKC